MSRTSFIEMIAPGAQEFQLKTGVFASVTISQACLETGYGAFIPVDKYSGQNSANIFGIKGEGPAGHVTCDTREVLDGVSQTVEAQFRAYHSVAESIADHGALLTKPWFKPVLAASTPEEACKQLYACGYATDAPTEVDGDPSYDEKLIGIINYWNLKRFDITEEEKIMIEQLLQRMEKLEARVQGLESTSAEQQDQNVSDWAEKSVEKAEAIKVLVGDGHGFNPKQPVTREQLATTFDRLGLLERKEG